MKAMPNKNLIQISFASILLLVLLSCGKSTSLIEECKTVLETDRSFSAYSQEHGMAASFYKYASDKAVMLRDNSYPVKGKENIKALFLKTEVAGNTLIWEPEYVDVAASRDLAYTYGFYKYITPDSTFRGSYVSIWKKDENNNWKYVFDAGTSGLGKEK
ncbi:hypothetical protein DWB61_08540 [Ancylomarina euxinus]|uniref:DUF4440 domain-containing protein n=2 Tax=Ancylomarina euxinus TaxID=2283627 RepID=A0A425Y1G5_9BACT|nr:hypothetical protein [Ancylomarina euxinus]RRG21794.1 hypothetical protein DWB61_08540 [Ancylomarina euxinus]